jgi:hypothetical protein
MSVCFVETTSALFFLVFFFAVHLSLFVSMVVGFRFLYRMKIESVSLVIRSLIATGHTNTELTIHSR